MPARTASARSLYLYTSQTANNGSAFAGITGNTLWYNTTGGIAMLIGRYFVIVPMMAVAGSLVAKKIVPASAGTFPTHGGLFVGLLVGVILIVGGLTFFPALALGPIVEHFAMHGRTVVLIELPESAPMETSQLRKRMPVTALTDPKIVVACDRLGLRQARSARHDEEPRDVRGRGRGGADHRDLPPRLA